MALQKKACGGLIVLPKFSTMVLVIQACHVMGAKYEGLKVHSYVIQGEFWALPLV